MPGVAVAVVYKDEVIFSKGYGVREVGKPEKVDENTVFQLASVSKPLASTVVAAAVGEKAATWTEPVITYRPWFALNDPYVTEHATLADLFWHRSGLSEGAGDLLEDLGWDRDYILGKLDQQPLDGLPFDVQLQQLRRHRRRCRGGRCRRHDVGRTSPRPSCSSRWG